MKRAAMLLAALAATSAAAEEVTVTAVPLPSFQNAAIGQRVQGLVYRGGLQLSSVHDDFGGLSGIGFTGPDGKLAMVSDEGNFVSGQLIYDETGAPLSGSTTTAIVATGILEKNPGATILHNCICSKAVPEVVREHGGTPVRTKVGHSFIKAVMAETGAAFAGEHSAHYYFRDNYRADSGLIAAVVALGELSASDRTLSELLAPLRRYFASGEINSVVDDQQARIEAIARHFEDGRQDRLDGLTVEFDDWWCNVRPSNTEPLLRLNAEARTPELLAEKTAEVLELIRGGGPS